MSSHSASAARDGALAKLAAEAARFTRDSDSPSPSSSTPATPRPSSSTPWSSRHNETPASVSTRGYVPVAVAPERGNTRPVVPVGGRLHMRMAQETLDGLDQVVAEWRSHDPVGLRDLERATLVRIGIAMLLTDVAANGWAGASAEAVRHALNPAVRHTDTPMPDLTRWLRSSPEQKAPGDDAPTSADPRAVASFGSRPPG